MSDWFNGVITAIIPINVVALTVTGQACLTCPTKPAGFQHHFHRDIFTLEVTLKNHGLKKPQDGRDIPGAWFDPLPSCS
jgi:hypothetical protein